MAKIPLTMPLPAFLLASPRGFRSFLGGCRWEERRGNDKWQRPEDDHGAAIAPHSWLLCLQFSLRHDGGNSQMAPTTRVLRSSLRGWQLCFERDPGTTGAVAPELPRSGLMINPN